MVNEQFVSAPQGRTCRYSSKTSSSDIAGLYTDNFSSCIIYIIYGKNTETDEIRISMTHADETIVFAQISKEIEWVSERCNGIQKFVIRKSPISDLIAKKISESEQFEHKGLEKNIFAVSVSVKLTTKDNQIVEIRTYLRDNITKIKLLVHPKEWEIQAYYNLNLILSPEIKKNNCRLLFDGEHWGAPQNHDTELTNDKLDFFERHKFKAEDTLYEVIQKSNSILNNPDSGLVFSMAVAICTILNCNDWDKIIKNSIQDIVKKNKSTESSIVCQLNKISNDEKFNIDVVKDFIQKNLNDNHKHLKSFLLGAINVYARMKLHSSSSTDIPYLNFEEKVNPVFSEKYKQSHKEEANKKAPDKNPQLSKGMFNKFKQQNEVPKQSIKKSENKESEEKQTFGGMKKGFLS